MLNVLLILILIILVLVLFSKQMQTNNNPKKNITIQTLDSSVLHDFLQEDDHDFIIIDIRTAREFDRGHIKDAININVADKAFKNMIKRFEKNDTYIVYGQREQRSQKAAQILITAGFSKVYNLFGGMLEWQMLNYPLEKTKQEN